MRNETQGENRIVSQVGAGLCNGEGERAYTRYTPTLEGESTENFVRHLRKVIFFKIN